MSLCSGILFKEEELQHTEMNKYSKQKPDYKIMAMSRKGAGHHSLKTCLLAAGTHARVHYRYL